MDKSLYLKDEKLISESDNKLITLTNFRVRYNSGRKTISILLCEISSIEIHYIANIWFLIISVISGIAGLVSLAINGGATELVIGLAISATFYSIYRGTRKHTLSIGSSSNRIDFFIKGLSHENVLGFVNDLEEAILKQSNK